MRASFLSLDACALCRVCPTHTGPFNGTQLSDALTSCSFQPHTHYIALRFGPDEISVTPDRRIAGFRGSRFWPIYIGGWKLRGHGILPRSIWDESFLRCAGKFLNGELVVTEFGVFWAIFVSEFVMQVRGTSILFSKHIKVLLITLIAHRKLTSLKYLLKLLLE